jgi:hypothetical protein
MSGMLEKCVEGCLDFAEFNGEIIILDKNGIKYLEKEEYIENTKNIMKITLCESYLYALSENGISTVDLKRGKKLNIFEKKNVVDFVILNDVMLAAIRDRRTRFEKYLRRDGEWVFHKELLCKKPFSRFISAKMFLSGEEYVVIDKF